MRSPQLAIRRIPRVEGGGQHPKIVGARPVPPTVGTLQCHRIEMQRYCLLILPISLLQAKAKAKNPHLYAAKQGAVWAAKGMAAAFTGLLTTSSVMVAFEFTAHKLHPAAVAAAQVPDTLAALVLLGAVAGSVLGSLVLSVSALPNNKISLPSFKCQGETPSCLLHPYALLKVPHILTPRFPLCWPRKCQDVLVLRAAKHVVKHIACCLSFPFLSFSFLSSPFLSYPTLSFFPFLSLIARLACMG